MALTRLILACALLSVPAAAGAGERAASPAATASAVRPSPPVATPRPAPAVAAFAPRTTVSLSLGASGGLGGEAYVTFDGLAQGLPASPRLAIGYRVLDPGIPLDARHVFINANDNGEPEERGSRWDFRLDAVFRSPWRDNLWITAGPRYSAFTGNFKFIGGNEFFDVTTRQWGFGVGAESRFPMGARTTLEIGAGIDRYLDATFAGHDTEYNPDGTIVSQVDNYTYADADQAIHQPTWAPRFVVGVGYRLGR
jgi:hypothetical protein